MLIVHAAQEKIPKRSCSITVAVEGHDVVLCRKILSLKMTAAKFVSNHYNYDLLQNNFFLYSLNTTRYAA